VKRRSGLKSCLDESDDRSHLRDEDDDALRDDVGCEALQCDVVSNLLELSRVSRTTPKCGQNPYSSGSLCAWTRYAPAFLASVFARGVYVELRLTQGWLMQCVPNNPADLERIVKDQRDLRNMSYQGVARRHRRLISASL
jgi:hypothetical protein